jgi:hypothetical protein
MSGSTFSVSKSNYLKEAASEPGNIWSMVGFLSAAAFTQNVMFIAAGVVVEAAYLSVVPASTLYRRYVERRAARRNQQLRRLQREELIRTFEPRDREMVEYLRFQKSKIYENYMKFTQLREVPSSLQRLDVMWEEFVDLLDIYRRRKNHLRSINRQSIQNQILQNQRSLSQSDSGTRALLERNLEILQRRLQTFDEIEKSVRRVEAELQSIENAFSLVNDQVVTMHSVESVTALELNIDELLNNIEVTKQILEETTPILSSLNAVESGNNPAPIHAPPPMRFRQYE